MLRRRRKEDSTSDDDDNVTIDSEENAWWASRDELDSDKAPSGRTKKKPPVEAEEKRNTFEEYFSAESLFDWTGAEGSGVLDETDPYVVLGLPPSASWEEISATHRRLAKLHHPDRLVNATEEERETGDRRIRDLNIAYMELRRRKGR